MRTFSLILILLFAMQAWGFERTVKLQWEPVDEAVQYDLEIGLKGRTQAFKTVADLKVANWAGVLGSGAYWMRVRARDDRGVPSDWSENINFDVLLAAPYSMSPLQGAEFTPNADDTEINFKWTPVAGAQQYQLTVMDHSNKPIITQKFKAPNATLKLPSSMTYRWFAQALDENSFVGEKPKDIVEFTVFGPVLPTPTIVKPETEFVRRIDMDWDPSIEHVKIRVQRYDEKEKKWIQVQEGKLTKRKFFGFLKTWPGGKYQVTAQGFSGFRSPSAIAELTFSVVSGTRSVAAEHKSLIRQSIDKSENWFATATYVISQVSYQGISIEDNTALGLTALTGTGLIGLGRFWQDSPWGLYGSLDYGGLTIQGKTRSFLGLELSTLYKHRVGSSGDMRYRFGVYNRDFPEVTDTSPTTVSLTKITGLLLSAEYWHAISRKVGLQASIGLKPSLAGTSEVGGTVMPALSYQFGVLMSYRWQPTLAGLLGYNYRVDHLRRNTRNLALDTEGISEVRMAGHYVNLVLEYGF